MNELNDDVKSILKTATGNIISSDYNKALEQLKKAEVLDKDNPEILYNLGITYTRLELYKTALDYFTKVLSLEAQFIDIIHVKKNISFCLIQQGKYTESLKLLNEVLIDYPYDITALNMKGYCLEKTGKINDALRVYSIILKNDKKNINSMNSTAYLMAKKGININKALEIAKYVLKKNKNNPAYNDTLGYIYYKSGNFDDAEKYFNLAIKDHPFNNDIIEHINELKIAVLNKK